MEVGREAVTHIENSWEQGPIMHIYLSIIYQEPQTKPSTNRFATLWGLQVVPSYSTQCLAKYITPCSVSFLRDLRLSEWWRLKSGLLSYDAV
jgi:hypothetical protein